MWGRGEEEMRGDFLQQLTAMRNCRPLSLSLSLSPRVSAYKPKQTSVSPEHTKPLPLKQDAPQIK